jgi:hypothetical protein
MLNLITSPQYYMPANLHANCSASSHCPSGVPASTLLLLSLPAPAASDTNVPRYNTPQHNMECVSGVCRNSSVFFHDAAPLGLSWDAEWGQWTHSKALYLGRHPQPLWTEPTYARLPSP